MKTAVVILVVVSVLSWRWWEFLCVRALGGMIQVLCDTGFVP